MPVSHLESPLDGARLPADTLQTTHRGRPLLVRYETGSVDRSVLADRPFDLWRYRELLPVGEEVVSLGETVTPLLE